MSRSQNGSHPNQWLKCWIAPHCAFYPLMALIPPRYDDFIHVTMHDQSQCSVRQYISAVYEHLFNRGRMDWWVTAEVACEDPFCGSFTPACLWSVNITFDHRNTPFICSICDWCCSRPGALSQLSPYQTTLTPPGNILHVIRLIMNNAPHILWHPTEVKATLQQPPENMTINGNQSISRRDSKVKGEVEENNERGGVF